MWSSLALSLILVVDLFPCSAAHSLPWEGWMENDKSELETKKFKIHTNSGHKLSILPNRTMFVTHVHQDSVLGINWFAPCNGTQDPAALTRGETFQLCQAGYPTRKLMFNQVLLDFTVLDPEVSLGDRRAYVDTEAVVLKGCKDGRRKPQCPHLYVVLKPSSRRREVLVADPGFYTHSPDYSNSRRVHLNNGGSSTELYSSVTSLFDELEHASLDIREWRNWA